MKLVSHSAGVFVLMLLLAVALRFSTFGDPNIHGDEVFYMVVGQAMHHGALPYVDVWDRKPLGLFLIHFLISGVSTAPLAYQLAATAFAALTATVIAAIGRMWSSAMGGLLTGACYLLWLTPMQGYGAQSPVWYNLMIALAALVVLRARPALAQGRVPVEVHGAMALAGLAITVKTSALFEAAFLGIYAAWTLYRSPAPRLLTLRAVAIWALAGAAPTLLIMAVYWHNGHWPEYWHAMVLSNLDKVGHFGSSVKRLAIMTALLSPILTIAALGLRRMRPADRRFMLGWLIAALAGLFAVPNFFLHYGIPLLVPLCAAASLYLAGATGRLATVAIASLALMLTWPWQPGHAAASARAIDTLEQAIRAHVGAGPLLLYDAPPQLYQRTGQPFITPLVFPTHLSHGVEKDVSHLSTLGETQRVLALRPGAVVMAQPIRNGPVNEQTHQLVLAYVGRNCRMITVVPTLEWQQRNMIVVWGDCRR